MDGNERVGWLERLHWRFSWGSRRARRTLIDSIPEPERRFVTSGALLQHCVRTAPPDGMFLEFGVGSGKSSELIASGLAQRGLAQRLYGFDSFQGLPERWRIGVPKGAFRREAPPVVGERIELEVGWFQETLEPFLQQHPANASFVHVDCDLYRSAKFALETLARANRLVAGTVLDFDEYHGYPSWEREGEARALQELCDGTGFGYRIIGIVPTGQQFAVALTPRPNGPSKRI
ncbi:MAG TPA: class I SAM-dependent methyltransferase [Thermoplasmata archaeon]|nr:class I SAM-dependent methyltransferase [Thermoplasmata archaeon]